MKIEIEIEKALYDKIEKLCSVYNKNPLNYIQDNIDGYLKAIITTLGNQFS